MTSGFAAAKVAVGDTTTEAQRFAGEMNALRAQMPGIVSGIASPFVGLGVALTDASDRKAQFDQHLRDMGAQVEAEKAAKSAATEYQRLAKAFQSTVDVLTGAALAREVAEIAK